MLPELTVAVIPTKDVVQIISAVVLLRARIHTVRLRFVAYPVNGVVQTHAVKLGPSTVMTQAIANRLAVLKIRVPREVGNGSRR